MSVRFVSVQALHAAATRAGASGDQIRRAIAVTMYRVANPLRDKLRAMWKAEGGWKRNRKRSHRKAIVRAVQSIVRRRGMHWSALAGIVAKGSRRRARVVNVLDRGPRHKQSGKLQGHMVRAKMQHHLVASAASVQREVAIAAQQIVAGRIRGRGGRGGGYRLT